ncbi:unnamed protein product [Trypanosoma congolense IL3000]|uniref:WGS project CAEQ00000000 data, annotated contig 2235 n=1 Tax=Trypanosoma congolense (strain IL3000) TaxID=1068625 RepID=F9WCI3_TRYCI|nr:unnamed protein product [Trypanosoma congolense IL3000]
MCSFFFPFSIPAKYCDALLPPSLFPLPLLFHFPFFFLAPSPPFKCERVTGLYISFPINFFNYNFLPTTHIPHPDAVPRAVMGPSRDARRQQQQQQARLRGSCGASAAGDSHKSSQRGNAEGWRWRWWCWCWVGEKYVFQRFFPSETREANGRSGMQSSGSEREVD